MAPELAAGVGEVRPSADIFSFGVLAFEVFSRRLPHAVPPALDASFGRSPCAHEPVERAVPTLPAPLARLIEACLCPDPASRPSAREVMETLESVSSGLVTPIAVTGPDPLLSSERETLTLESTRRDG